MHTCAYVSVCACVRVCVYQMYAKVNSIFILVGRVFTISPGDRGSILGRVIQKTQKMVLDAAWLNNKHYKVRIKGKVKQCKERSSPPLHLGVIANEKGTFGSPLTTITNFT